MIFNKKLISILFILILNISIFANAEDDKYYFRGSFGTATLVNAKTNNIQGTCDLLIYKDQGVYNFQYNISLTNFDGNTYFSSKIAGPSAPKKEDGQVKIALSYTNPTVTSTTFIGKGSQSLSISSPANNFIPTILNSLSTSDSNYDNEQFFVTFNVKGDSSPVTRAQLFYVDPNSGTSSTTGSASTTGSTSTTGTSSTGSSTTGTPHPSATSTVIPTESPSSTETPDPLNPGGVEDSTENNDNSNSSDSNAILPTLGVVAFFVISLVIMS